MEYIKWCVLVIIAVVIELVTMKWTSDAMVIIMLIFNSYVLYYSCKMLKHMWVRY